MSSNDSGSAFPDPRPPPSLFCLDPAGGDSGSGEPLPLPTATTGQIGRGGSFPAFPCRAAA